MTTAIDYFSMGHPLSRLRSHFAWRARERMLQRFLTTLQAEAHSRVLDLGVTPDISLPESNHFEQRYPWPEQLTAASIEPVDGLAAHFPRIKFVQIAPGPLPFEDNAFDLCFCSAVIEHVGSRENQLAFVKELSRVSRKGFLLTTPNRWFPLDFHTITPLIHWLPQHMHQAILRALGHTFWSRTENLNLLGRSDLLRICEAACPDGAHVQVDTISLAGWPSNLIAWSMKK